MKTIKIDLEGMPEKVEYYNDSQLKIDDISFTDINSYDFTVAMAKAYWKRVLTTEDKESAYKAIIEALSEAIEIDTLDDIETEVVTLREEVQELNDHIQDMIEG